MSSGLVAHSIERSCCTHVAAAVQLPGVQGRMGPGVQGRMQAVRFAASRVAIGTKIAVAWRFLWDAHPTDALWAPIAVLLSSSRVQRQGASFEHVPVGPRLRGPDEEARDPRGFGSPAAGAP